VGRVDAPPSGTEQQALEEYVKGGGILLILAGGEASGGSAALAELTSRFGVTIGTEKTVSLVPGRCKWSQILPGMKEAGNGGLLAGLAPPFLEAREGGWGSHVKTLLEYRGHPLIVEAPHGRGRVVVVPADVFVNGFMCLPGALRRMPFKPGNQQLAKNLGRYLLGSQMPRVLTMEVGEQQARLRLRGRGGEMWLHAPFKQCAVRIDGTDAAAEIKDGIVAVTAPRGEVLIELVSGHGGR
jgi:hypothetical protein